MGQNLGSLGAAVSPRMNINSSSVQVLFLVRFPFLDLDKTLAKAQKTHMSSGSTRLYDRIKSLSG